MTTTFKDAQAIKQFKDSQPCTIKKDITRNNIGEKPIQIIHPNQHVIDAKSNASITIGPNGPFGAGSGTGGVGNINSSDITLRAGMGTAIKSSQVPDDKKIEPNPYYDSATISISETIDVDHSYGYKGSVKGTSKNASAIALNADEIRAFARGEIKLVTGIHQNDASAVVGGSNAPSHPQRDFSGISLVANNDDTDLQPMVKGENLEAFLKSIVSEMRFLYEIIDKLIKHQKVINIAVKTHYHTSDFTGAPLIPMTDSGLSLAVDMNNSMIDNSCINALNIRNVQLNNLENNFLNSSNNIRYINSRFNKTN